MKLNIRVQPRSSKEGIIQLSGNSYKVHMREPALEGKANKKLVEILAEYFGTKKRDIEILSGHKSRNKVVNIVV
ncbi:MAG: YggU family protein [Candidatus Omnitrophica bacterium]|nr:YggU family protein [Candidatus Omnitrophota bacterium]